MNAVSAPNSPGDLKAIRPPLPTAKASLNFIYWTLACGFTVYLALSGGGYDIVVRSELGIVLWWLVLLGILVGVVPRSRIPRAGWIAGGLLAAFLAWTWIGLSWTSSHELTLDQVSRVSTYLGAFLLSLCVVDRDSAPVLLGGIAAGIAIVCGAAVMSKLAPSLFPVDTARQFYATPRLSYPFDYADAVGEFAALGVPLLLYTATTARALPARAASAAALPVVLLTIGMTVSRGGILAATVGIVVVFALLPDRISRLPTFALVTGAIAVLMVALLHRPALRDQVGVAPGSERHSMLAIVIAVVIATGVLQALLVLLQRRFQRPSWLTVSRRAAQRATVAVCLVVVAIVTVAAAGGTIASLWNSFKQPNPTSHSNQYFRLLSLAGSHRYQYWQVAIRAFDSSPLTGIGPGTFRFYWAQHQTLGEFVLNAHSLWIETLAETGLIGIVLLAGFFLHLIGRGAVVALRSDERTRALVAAATALTAGFCAAAAFDWVWQIGVIPMVAMVVAAPIVADLRGSQAERRLPETETMAPATTEPATAEAAQVLETEAPATAEAAQVSETEAPATAEAAQVLETEAPATAEAAQVSEAEAPASGEVRVSTSAPTPYNTATPASAPARLNWPLRAVLAAAAILAICLIAIPLARTVAIRSSQAAVAQGDLRAAMNDAMRAQRLQPGAASPRLQRALILEQAGNLAGASQAISQAIAREPNAAQLWLVASRIATERNRPVEALRDYRRARSLDPTSPIFG